MTYKEFKLIDEISSDEFPLMDIVRAFSILNYVYKGKLQGIDYKMVEKDLVKIAKAFKFYYEQSEHWYH